MRILFYSQHVLGMGHLFRSLELVRALAGHEVLMVTGGAAVEAGPTPHATRLELEPLMMDAGFSRLVATDSIDAVKARRREALLDAAEAFRPQVVLVELFPFGRKRFAFERPWSARCGTFWWRRPTRTSLSAGWSTG